MPTGLIFDIKRFALHDGPGIRTTVFFKGCPLSCWWCHNPESRGREPLLHYAAARCLACHECVDVCPEGAVAATADGSRTDPGLCRGHGACAAVCPSEARRIVGRRYTAAELLAEIEKDRVFHDEAGGGVTFSGGEPLLQWRFLLEILTACGERGIHRAVDTSGVAAPEVLLRVAEETDLFLYDLKTLDADVHMEATGAPLRPILDNLSRLLDAGARVRIRIPLVPGVNDGENLDRTGAFLATLPGIEGVHLLPFHRSARDKHRRFGLPWHLPDDLETPPEVVDTLFHRMERRGLSVTVGG